MGLKQQFLRRAVRQFHNPTGFAGHAVGWFLGRRSSNVQRNRWVIDLLDLQPTDRVLELGCGPGVAIAAAARRVTEGVVVGVDQSPVMIGQARRRNVAAVRDGRVVLVCSPVEHLELDMELFDVVLAVNSFGIWPDPPVRLRQITGYLRPGGQIALVSQPRCPGATAATSAAAADELTRLITEAGFVDVRTDTLDLDLPVVCVRGRVRIAPTPAAHGGSAARSGSC